MLQNKNLSKNHLKNKLKVKKIKKKIFPYKLTNIPLLMYVKSPKIYVILKNKALKEKWQEFAPTKNQRVNKTQSLDIAIQFIQNSLSNFQNLLLDELTVGKMMIKFPLNFLNFLKTCIKSKNLMIK